MAQQRGEDKPAAHYRKHDFNISCFLFEKVQISRGQSDDHPTEDSRVGEGKHPPWGEGERFV